MDSQPDGHVLIVEDDPAIAGLMATLLEEVQVPAEVARTGNQALASVRARPPRLMILDLGLPGLYGTSVAVALRRERPALPIVVVSAAPTRTVAEDAWSIGARRFLTKPFECDEFVDLVRQELRTAS
jgi:two-component system KDP operon response regulator KdpE